MLRYSFSNVANLAFEFTYSTMAWLLDLQQRPNCGGGFTLNLEYHIRRIQYIVASSKDTLASIARRGPQASFS